MGWTRKPRKGGVKQKSGEEMSASSTISKRVKEEEQSNGEDENSRAEQEEALVALIEHRTKEVEHLRQRISYYKSQVLPPFPHFFFFLKKIRKHESVIVCFFLRCLGFFLMIAYRLSDF